MFVWPEPFIQDAVVVGMADYKDVAAAASSALDDVSIELGVVFDVPDGCACPRAFTRSMDGNIQVGPSDEMDGIEAFDTGFAAGVEYVKRLLKFDMDFSKFMSTEGNVYED